MQQAKTAIDEAVRLFHEILTELVVVEEALRVKRNDGNEARETAAELMADLRVARELAKAEMHKFPRLKGTVIYVQFVREVRWRQREWLRGKTHWRTNWSGGDWDEEEVGRR